MDTTEERALGDNLQGGINAGGEDLDVGDVGLEVESTLGMVLLNLGLTSFLGENVEDLPKSWLGILLKYESHLPEQYRLWQ